MVEIKLFRNGGKTVNFYKKDFAPYSYFGFSITLARLFRDRKLFCVASAPKARSSGAVSNLFTCFTRSGNQFADYLNKS